MKYLQPSFTVATGNGKLTDEQYEIAVGIRNPDGSFVEEDDHYCVYFGDEPCIWCGKPDDTKRS